MAGRHIDDRRYCRLRHYLVISGSLPKAPSTGMSTATARKTQGMTGYQIFASSLDWADSRVRPNPYRPNSRAAQNTSPIRALRRKGKAIT